MRVGYAAADACRLPFAADSFDSTYCVAVLQHIRDLSGALAEIARVTRPGGRVLIVEPDNAARYWFSSVQSGMESFELSRRFFGGLSSVRGEVAGRGGRAVGAGHARRRGRRARVGSAVPGIGVAPRRAAARILGVAPHGCSRGISKAPDESLRRLGADFLKSIEQYARDASAAGAAFVEIQNTMLFATVGQRAE